MAGVPEGIDGARVSAWLKANIAEVSPPFTFELIAGGHSNLTFKVTGVGGSVHVLRRPPLGQVLATAHDMGREHMIISALAPTPVPVAPAFGYCADPDVTGAPFYVMGYVSGLVLHDTAAAAALSEPGRRVAGEHLVDVLADLHAVDPARVGLGELGRTEGYIARQLRRWSTQWEKSKTRELPAVERVHARLAASIPAQGPATIVHGDYRPGNCITGDDGRIRAVLDWELCTLGDPLADVGYLALYWGESGGLSGAAADSPTTMPGFPSRDEVLARYAARSGRDLGEIAYYVAFSAWKLACIVEGVYSRYLHGAMGAQAEGFELFAHRVEQLAATAEETIGG